MRLSAYRLRKSATCIRLKKGVRSLVESKVTEAGSTSSRQTVGIRSKKRNENALDIVTNPSLTSDAMHELLLAQASRSVIIERNGSCSETLEHDTEKMMEKFGRIEYFTSLHAQPGRSRYLLEFEELDSVPNVLNRGKDGAIQNRMIEIKTKNGCNASSHQQIPKHASYLDQAELKKILLNQESMEDQIEIIASRDSMNSDGIRSRYLFLFMFEQILRKNLQTKIKLKPFGSSLTGAGMPGSDLDILILSKHYLKDNARPLPSLHHLVDTETGIRDGLNKESMKTLESIEHVVRGNFDVRDVELISTARVPIIKFRYPMLDLPVDVVVDRFHGNNFFNIINWYVRFDPRVQLVWMTIRKWAESRRLLSHGIDYKGFTPFMLQMTLLTYLARSEVIPPLKKIGRVHRDCFVISVPPRQFLCRARDPASVAEFVCGFFDYFSSFGLRGRKLQLYHGTIVPRQYTRAKLWISNPFDNRLNVAAHCCPSKIKEMEDEIRNTAKVLLHRRKKLEGRDWGLGAILFKKEQ